MNTVEHLLVCVMEECAEIQHAISKALRFGLDHEWPDGRTNTEVIEYELNDLFGVLDTLTQEGVIFSTNTQAWIAKRTKLREMMKLSQEVGALTD